MARHVCMLMTSLVFLVMLAACAAPTPAPIPIPSPTQPPAPIAAAPTSTTVAASATPEAPQRRTSTPAATATSTPTRTPGPSATPAKPKPNIILVLADDLDAAEFAYMPKLKALIGDQGVTLPNYYVAMSLCCPSRATTLRGQYPHNTQVLGNDLPSGGFQKFFDLGEEKSTIATWLQDAGYTTMLAGKYLNGYPLASDPKHIPPGWTEWYSAMKGNPYSEYNYALNENGKMVAYGKNPEDYGTDVYVGKTVDFIQRTAKTGKPFFVYLAPYAPHQPYTPAPRHENLFPDLKAPRTANYNESDVSDKPAYIKNRPQLNQKTQDTIDEDYRKRLQSLQAVDEGIESIVNTLKASGQLDNTYIFFTSDNGYHLGNHRQITGKIAPYEEELRVSMMVRGPGVPSGNTVPNLAVNIDLAPTWADLAGVKAPDFVDGRSLVPLLGNTPPALTQWRQAFSIENGEVGAEEVSTGEQVQAEADPGMKEPQDQDEVDAAAPAGAGKKNTLAIPAFRGVHTQTMNYVEYVTGEKELYDLKADPFELNNLASKADPKLLAALSQRVKDLSACKQDACRTAENALIQ
jgi:N-acetylglucosamine-6-sulfatase